MVNTTLGGFLVGWNILVKKKAFGRSDDAAEKFLEVTAEKLISDKVDRLLHFQGELGRRTIRIIH